VTLKKIWPSITEKAEDLDDFTSLAAPAAKLVIDLFSILLKEEAQDLTLLLWHHLVLDYLGDWSESDCRIQMTSRLPKSLAPSVPRLEQMLPKLVAGYGDVGKTSPSPQLILRLLLARLKEGTTAPPELEWIFNLIMTQGCLRWGRASSQQLTSPHPCEDLDRAVAVFDCKDRDLVLTPQMRDPSKDAAERRLWMRYFRQQPGSWIIGRPVNTTAADSNAPVLKTTGMVRGLWKIGDIKPKPYILS
jgi:hypothetical protein